MATSRRYGSRSFEASNEDKVLFPDAGITKGDLIDYYERVADVLLPHARGRIVTMRRFPDGIDGKSFYQKEVPGHFPDWIDTVTVQKEDGTLRQLTVEHVATLAYLANQACIPLHVWPSRADRPHHPDRLLFDLDPSGDDFAPVRRAARTVLDLIEEVGLTGGVMTTGSRGLHVVVPLDREADFEVVRAFAADAAKLVAAREPDRFTVEQRKANRGGRVFLDVLRNAYGQHGIAPYAVRALPGAPVATPLDRDELSDPAAGPRRYTVRNLFRRLGQKDDPWRGLARHAAGLEQPRRRLDHLLRDEGIETTTDD